MRHRFLFLGRLEDGPFTLSPPPREEVLTAIQAKVQGTGQRVKGRSRVQITSPNMKRHGVQRSYPMRMRSLRAISDSDLKLLSRSLGSTSHWVFYRSLHNSGDPGPENFRVEAIGGHHCWEVAPIYLVRAAAIFREVHMCALHTNSFIYWMVTSQFRTRKTCFHVVT